MSDELRGIHERLARMETTQEHQGKLLEKIDSKLDRQDARLDEIEKRSAGFAVIAGGVVSVGVSLITAKLMGKA
ncbi:hypothetical protein MKI84_08490 [Ancylobacter sp. A5.8]|uniref:hypothetical protein n=1 Tax=Ancylobacter gelatini TaxID=2919920 RepID=UPI001F4E7FB2|nr:hypothetical protein [Ancylobacter gelatini]MCJ8142953.1 hypothetical protein [Ancylobacter gelatini]